jgi:retinol-binding protein 3
MSRSRTVLHRSAVLVLALFVFLSVSPARSQQVVVPDTPAGHVLAAWLEAFNSADRARMAAYRETYESASPGQALDALMSFRSQTGGFDLLSIEKNEPLRIEFMIKERASDTRALGKFEVTGGERPQVTSTAMRAIPPGSGAPSYSIDAPARDQAIAGAILKLNEYYVFPETAKNMEQDLRRRQKRGEYDAITDGDKFAILLTDQLQGVSHDKHLRVNFMPGRIPEVPTAGPTEPTAQQLADMRRDMERNNCGFQKVELLDGNVGYIKFNMFAPADVCSETAAAALGFVANADAIILDLRDNGGGSPGMVAFIASYLFDKPTHLNSLWTRKTDTTQQWWTLPVVPGRRMPTTPVFVLTSSRTFSGAEEFTYDLKNQKRAVIVGETTGGAAHLVRSERISDHFMMGVPFARAINPVSKTNWEGTGVEPDVKVASADALTRAQRLAAEKVAPAADAVPRTGTN